MLCAKAAAGNIVEDALLEDLLENKHALSNEDLNYLEIHGIFDTVKKFAKETIKERFSA